MNHRNQSIHYALLALAITFMSTTLFAQGGVSGVYEVGTNDQGASAAGAGARAEDAATAYFNPAGMSRLKGHQIHTGLIGAYVDRRFDVDSSAGGFGGTGEGRQVGGVSMGTGTYFVLDLDEKNKLGLTFNVPFVGTNDFHRDWVGNQTVIDEVFMVTNLEPAYSYKVNDTVSLGVGLNVYMLSYTASFLDAAGKTEIEADDAALGYTFGGLLELTPETRVGLFYRSGYDVKLEGDVDSNTPALNGDFTRETKMPQGANISLFHKAAPKCDLLLDVGWTDWSCFSHSDTVIGSTPVFLDRNFHDTWRIGIGARHHCTETFMFQCGLSYDSSPVDDEHRLPDVPADEVYRASVGFVYDMSANMSMGVSYTYADLGDARSKSANMPPYAPVSPVITGSYSTNRAHFIGLILNYKF